MLATLAVVFFAILVGSFENAIGILDVDIDDYQPATLLLEALTIAAALVALRRFRAPLLVLPIAVITLDRRGRPRLAGLVGRAVRCSRSWSGSR